MFALKHSYFVHIALIRCNNNTSLSMKGLVGTMGSNDKDEKKKKKKKSADAEPIVPAAEMAAPFQQPPSDIPVMTLPDEPKKRRRRGWIVAVCILLVVALLLLAVRALRTRQITAGAGAYTAYTVERGDITVTLSGSGTLQPADSYTVTSLISGDILSAPFEEGDIVQEDQTLFTVDSADVASSVKQAENNLKDSQYQYNQALRQKDNLKLKAGGDGDIIALSVEKGDTVQAGQVIATIRNSDVMTITVLFQRDTAMNFKVGQSADVTLSGTFETFKGTVSDIGTVDQVLQGNAIAREVTIHVKNPGAFSPSASAFVTINGVNGMDNGTFNYKYEGSVTATSTGTVSELRVAEGSSVTKNDIVAVLQNDTVDQQVHSAQSAVDNAKLALETQNNKVSDYTIKSPIAGTIVEKTYKEGDTLRAGELLCTVFDLSHLTLTLNVDELDIKQVQQGQTVTLTADASPDAVYNGTVTKVNIKGTTLNGVTSYPVTIRIDDTEGLLPGMNVDAKIVVEDLKDVLTVPVSAVLRNNFVLLKTDQMEQEQTDTDIPPGLVYTQVKLGPANDTDIVILEGLTEGDIVAVMDDTPSSYDYNPFQRQQGGGAAPIDDNNEQTSQASAGTDG